MNKIKIKKGDQVMVITGEYKGTKGTVLKVLYNSNKALVEGVNTVKRHTKPNSENPKGGIIEKQLPINISNISLMTKEGEKTRIGYKNEDGKKVRISTKSKEKYWMIFSAISVGFAFSIFDNFKHMFEVKSPF